MKQFSRQELEGLIDLQTKKGRQKEGRFLIEGEKVIEEAIKADVEIKSIVISEEFLLKKSTWLEKNKIEGQVIEEKWMKKISQLVTPPGIIASVAIPEISQESLRKSILIGCLLDIADPGNLGTMIRTADWFGVQTLLLSPQTVDPYNEKVIRSAMGSLFRVKCYQGQSILEDLQFLKRNGYQIIATQPHSQTTFQQSSAPICLIMGSEAHGIDQETLALADSAYTIPGQGKAESLNVAVSFGIALYDLQKTNK